MKVLMISTDQLVFKKGSAVRERMREYATLVDSLSVVVLGVATPTEVIGNLSLSGKGRWSALWWEPAGQFDLVTSQDPFETGYIAWLLARRLQAKLQLQIHTDFLSPYFGKVHPLNRIRALFARLLLPRADIVRVVSGRIKDSLVSRLHLPISKIVVLPIFVDIEKLRAAPIKTDLHKKYPQFDKIILIASRLTKEKNVGLAIEAVMEVIKSRPKTGLVIVGSGPEEQKLKAKALPLGTSIIFEPWSDDLPSYYKTADLFLNTSWYEGYGMSIVEALACGCPVVSTDVGVAREAGALVTTPDKLVDAIFSLLSVPAFNQLKLSATKENPQPGGWGSMFGW